MKIKQVKLQFITGLKHNKRDAEKLRGFFASRFRDDDYFHNHHQDGSSIYRMPLIQYKICEGILTVLGYQSMVPIVAEKFLKINSIELNGRSIKNFETSVTLSDEDFIVSEDLHEYGFESLWLCVNQNNYMNYINQKLDLNQVLVNHLLTNFKGYNIEAHKKIMVKGHYKEHLVKVNNKERFGFTGRFTTNVKMPDWQGIGKMKSVGFGCVKRIG